MLDHTMQHLLVSGPAAWTSPPSDLHDATDTNTFKKWLKSVVFDRAYP